jgi:hypothetical protein
LTRNEVNREELLNLVQNPNVPLTPLRAAQEIQMSADSTAANDFDTDMQTIRDYVRAVAEAKAKIATINRYITNYQSS